MKGVDAFNAPQRPSTVRAAVKVHGFQKTARQTSNAVRRFCVRELSEGWRKIRRWFIRKKSEVHPLESPALAGRKRRSGLCRAGRVPVVRPSAAASSVVGWWPSAKTLLLGVGLVGSRERVGKLSRSLCWRASLAESGCLCALAPRGAPRLLRPGVGPRSNRLSI